MFNLFVDTNQNIDWIGTLMKYLILIGVILLSIMLIIIIRRKYRKEASIKRCKSICLKAKAYAKKIKSKSNKRQLFIASTRLSKLCSILSNATYIMERVGEEKKDVVLDDITSSLDSLATCVFSFLEEAIFTKDEYEQNVEYVINNIDSIIDRINQYENDQTYNSN